MQKLVDVIDRSCTLHKLLCIHTHHHNVHHIINFQVVEFGNNQGSFHRTLIEAYTIMIEAGLPPEGSTPRPKPQPKPQPKSQPEPQPKRQPKPQPKQKPTASPKNKGCEGKRGFLLWVCKYLEARRNSRKQ